MIAPLLYQIFEGATVVFEVFTVYIYLSGFFQKKECGVARKILAYSTLCLVQGGVSIFYPNMVILPIVAVLGTIGIALALYEGDILTSIFAAFFYLAVGLAMEFFVPLVHSQLIGEELAAIHSPGFQRVLSTVTAKILILVIVRVIALILSKHKMSLSRRMWESTPLILSQLFLLVLMTSNFINAYFEHGAVTLFAMLEIVGVLFVNIVILWYFDVLVSSYELKYRNKVATMQLENQTKYFEVVKVHHDAISRKISAIEHDMRLHIGAIGSLAASEYRKDAEEYINSFSGVINENMMLAPTPHPVVSAWLSHCRQKASDLHAECTFDVVVSDQIVINPVDLTIIMGNTIDNALEAIAELDADCRKYIHIRIIQSEHFLLYEISNPFNAHKAKSRDRSNAQRGYGLWNIAASVAKYGGELTKEGLNGEFIVTIKLPC